MGINYERKKRINQPTKRISSDRSNFNWIYLLTENVLSSYNDEDTNTYLNHMFRLPSKKKEREREKKKN